MILCWFFYNKQKNEDSVLVHLSRKSFNNIYIAIRKLVYFPLEKNLETFKNVLKNLSFNLVSSLTIPQEINLSEHSIYYVDIYGNETYIPK